MTWMDLIVTPEQTDALPPVIDRDGNKTLWKVGTIWIFRSCRGVGVWEDQLQECWWQEVQ